MSGVAGQTLTSGEPPRLLLGTMATSRRLGIRTSGAARRWSASRARGALILSLMSGLVLALFPVGLRAGAAVQAPRPSQAQAASRFLRAVLRADYAAAYSQVAPEVRRAVGSKQFAVAARPLRKIGQQRGSAIELYKLGMRLGENGATRLFYTFSFARDSSQKPPPILLEVTFRDTASRAILGFSLRQARNARR